MKDFFVSYNRADRAWAEWIAWTLEEAGYTVVLQSWDFRPGENFVLAMHEATTETQHTVVVLSDSYLAAEYTQPEWAAAFAEDPRGAGRKLIPIRVAPCKPGGLLRSIIYVDLVGLAEKEVEAALLDALRDRAKPPEKPSFPSATADHEAVPRAVAFPAAQPADRISLHRLPVTGEVFVGREGELAQLDRAWEEPGVHVISLVAWGGVGKSALVNRWLGGMERDGFPSAERVFAWSFYSQGSGERAESADAFFNEALRWFGDPDPAAGTAIQRSERLVRLVRGERTLLVLDGLEPLQHPPGPLEGRLKDPALAVLVKELASASPGLCVITTREKVAELASRAGTTAPRIDLEHLAPEAGAELLKELGVTGSKRELEDAAREFGGHALALTLLGTYLRDVCEGDVRRRHEARMLEQDVEQGGHAERMMASYEAWSGPGPEVAVLRLLGLFDRPADRESLAALRAAPPIPGLTDALFHQPEKPGRSRKNRAAEAEPLADAELARALARLRKAGLLAEPSPGDGGALDTHPLVRTYFGNRLQAAHPVAWREGNRRLYEHLQAAAPDLPDTLEEMLPLYAAVLHGCRAGRHQEALAEVYYRRIQRKEKSYSTKKLGVLGAELAALSGFFDRPWDRLAGGLTAAAQGYVLAVAGFNLRALGRLAEAVVPMQGAVDLAARQEDWANAARSASNLSELTLTLGDLAQAVVQAEQSIELADRSRDEPQKISKRTTLADAAHQAGQISRAEALFQEAESMQERFQPQYPRLYSFWGYRYCDLFLGRIDSALAGLGSPLALEESERLSAICQEVRQRAELFLSEEVYHLSLLSIALYHLALGRAHLAAYRVKTRSTSLAESESDSLDLAARHLGQAVDGMRRAGTEDQLPRGLLARAALRRVQGDAVNAAADLDEVFEIAERGGMRLFACDAHLESARLALSTGDPTAAREHLAKARALVEATGYHRRDPEVAALVKALLPKPDVPAEAARPAGPAGAPVP